MNTCMIVSLIEKMLDGCYEPSEVAEQLGRYIDSSMNSEDRFRFRCACRLVSRYSQFLTNKASCSDLAIAMRNFILFNSRVRVGVDTVMGRALSEAGLEKFGMIREIEDTLNCKITIPPWFKWKEFLDSVYWRPGLQNVHSFPSPSPGDGLLEKLTGRSQYLSFEQKAAVYSALHLPEGYTVLISLPTGGGKSLIAQMIAFASDGLTIVVVPTVALAIDQVRAAKKMLSQTVNDENVDCYHSGTPEEKVIYGVASRKIRLLFISPEALMRNTRIHEVVSEAALSGYLTNVVIDEAHLIPEWGDQFRPDFQCFSMFKNELLEKSRGKLRTFLFSATLTDDCVDLLRFMYAEKNRWVEVRAESLRKEPRFCSVECASRKDKEEKLLQMVCFLPRPMIVYVASPDEAERWSKILQKDGFITLRTFTGDTPDEEREEIITAWNREECDLIVATSAFGMGVDKADVRSIIHACVPENPNRFYQEIGRGGRDGLPSLSVLCVEKKKDCETAFGLISSKVLTSERLLARWKGMTTGKSAILFAGNRYRLDTYSRPANLLEDVPSGKRNVQWNVNTILFFIRHGYIRPLDISFVSKSKSYVIEVELLDPSLSIDEAAFLLRLEDARTKEREHLERNFRLMVQLVENPHKKCWLETFAEMYPYVPEECAGCPNHSQPSWSFSSVFSLHKRIVLDSGNSSCPPKLAKIMGTYSDMLIECSMEDLQKKEVLERLILRACELGVGSVIQHEWNLRVMGNGIAVFSLEELEAVVQGKHWLLLGSAIMCVYGSDEVANGRVWHALSSLQKAGIRVIHCFCVENMKISGFNKSIKDHVDGYSFSLEDFLLGADRDV